MRILKLTARIITGIVFIFSGTVKAIDPLGSVYKFEDYFRAFDLGFLKSMSLPLTVLLCTAEFICGFSVLTGIRQKYGITGVLILMAIFTPLTLVLAISNPVSDCGCFGDAIHLTNWQTFYKNIILIAFAIILFKYRNEERKEQRPLSGWLAISGAAIIFIGFIFYNLIYLPVIDFLPYKKGANISELMTIPEGAPADVYTTTFIYEKDGVKKEFDLTNYPTDSTWKFVEQKSVLVKKGYKPPIHDFSITAMNGEDITAKVLSKKGYTMLMVSKKLPEADKMSILDGIGRGRHLQGMGVDFYLLSASSSEEISMIPDLQICSADETTLKTMVRSNPGYILLHDGVITGKWSHAGLPEKEKLDRLIKE